MLKEKTDNYYEVTKEYIARFEPTPCLSPIFDVCCQRMKERTDPGGEKWRINISLVGAGRAFFTKTLKGTREDAIAFANDLLGLSVESQ